MIPASCSAADQDRDVFVFKFHHFSAIDADQVIVIGGIEKIGIIDSLVSP
jgi:hypothetical protein